MRGALEQGQFFLLYQPQVALKGGRLVGAEALLRWQHPTLAMISPAEFISIAEANGFICDLGQFMFKEACKGRHQLAGACQRRRQHFTRSVFCAATCFPIFRAALAISGLAPHRLHVEITESMFLEKSEELLEKLEALRGLGVTIGARRFWHRLFVAQLYIQLAAGQAEERPVLHSRHGERQRSTDHRTDGHDTCAWSRSQSRL